jgi:hypothetical protein
MTDRTPAAPRRADDAPPDDPTRPHDAPARTTRAGERRLGGPEGNARVTGLTAAVLLVMLAAEGATLVQVHAWITPHVVIGMVLVPFVLLKMGTTTWRMVNYYRGPGPYRDRGAPPLLLRLLGPVVVLLTLLVFASGIALLLVPHSLRDSVFFVHKASFVLWFGAMTIHVLGHVLETSRLAPADLVARTRRQVRGAGVRLWAQAGCLVVGVVLAALIAPTIGPWLVAGGAGGG